MRVALVHDFLTTYGGAERVLEAMLEIYPRADIYTSVYDLNSFPKNALLSGRGDRGRPPQNRGWQGQLFGFKKRSLAGGVGGALTLFFPLIFERYNFSEYDLVISSSSNFAKGIIVPPGTTHVAYIHTPPRFLYGFSTESNWRGRRVMGALLKPIDSALRIWDYQAARRADYVLTNSKIVAKRVQKFYKREANVIYPPVGLVDRVGEGRGDHSPGGEEEQNTTGLSPAGGDYFLVVSRLSKYKNIDLVLKAAALLPNLELKIVGTGAERKKLKVKCQRLNVEGRVEFLGFVSDYELVSLYAGAKALVCPTEDEDFGITPVEAMACGTPVVALRSGGYQETVVEGKTGVFFNEPRAKLLAKALEGFNSDNFDSQKIKVHAQNFSKARFQRELQDFIEEVV